MTMTDYIEKCTVVNRLIDLENEFQQYKPFHGFEHAMYRKICKAEIAIGKTPAADVVPVRHGMWEKQSGLYSCSECGTTCPYDVQADVIEYWTCNYCPNCGAKMDGKSNVPRTEGE